MITNISTALKIPFDKREDIPLHLLSHLIMAEIYTPAIIMRTYEIFKKLPPFLQELPDKFIANLIKNADEFSEKEIQTKLNTYWTKRGLLVLKGYQKTPLPLTESTKAYPKAKHVNLLSPNGEKALLYLTKAAQKRIFTRESAFIGQISSNKILLDLSLYKNFDIPADTLVRRYNSEAEDKYASQTRLSFPILQLTKGCPNNCSHCIARAQPKITHMPYPLFLQLHNHLWKTYKNYPTKNNGKWEETFNVFFNDSDLAIYHDPIINADSGDIVLNLKTKNAPIAFLTRGIVNDISKRALSKVFFLKHPVTLSFVDTPLENKVYALSQMQKTIRLAESLNAKSNILLTHYCLKSGPSVSDDIFLGITSVKEEIFYAGRAKNLPKEEVKEIDDHNFATPYVIEPDASLKYYTIKNGEYSFEIINNLLQPNSQKKRIQKAKPSSNKRSSLQSRENC